ncbi:serine/threonine-protein kinase [Frankia sp. AgB1.9]|uniref:protein kinase domain-containing protein n=1 Tax=unclassified Frankia TaxID=2632575 RepID=UPI001932AE24|nr:MULTISPECIES: protein kinase [unclassified Frankia]MBL7488846.1 serine/threonine-protein kinase [Frankia sp. AgW1.1]MBL7546490.1 serine/threonine-protein kinase [Frankia sp. AgB1.9]MBL7620251.1 serine/threonine-protein kinase [Frankia sp. AgB1.8]
MADVAGAEPLQDGDPKQVGPYPLSGRLGVGGMGSVYLGHTTEGRPVAIKVIRQEFAENPDFRRRFLREVRAARRVARFCTAEVLDVDVEGPEPYLVTEYVEGPTLGARVRQDGPLPPAELERLAAAVANALTAIHAAHVVHRDLKPANILLSPSGARVIDFGIAHALESTTLHTRGGIVGTPAYMAPEQALGLDLTPAADVYAWGGVLLYAASGRSPFGEAATPVLLHRVVHDEPDFSCLDGGLLALVRRAMSKEPAARPSAHELLLTLAAGSDVDVSASQPVMAAALATGAATPAVPAVPAAPTEPTPWTTAQPEPLHVDTGQSGAGHPPTPDPAWPIVDLPRPRHRALLAGVAVAVVLLLVGVFVSLYLLSSHGDGNPTGLARQHSSTPAVAGPTGRPEPGGHAGAGSNPLDGTAGAATTPPAQPRSWLVFKRFAGDSSINDSPIVVVSPDGTERQLGTGDAPSVAADGRVAYAGVGGQIVTVRPDGTDARQLATSGDSSAEYPAWSPDGTQIAYFRNTGGLYLMQADGTGARRVAGVHGLETSWSPDGREIVFRDPDSQTLKIVSTADGSVRTLTGAPHDGAIPVEPSWSPDGKTIVFGSDDGGIYAIAPDGTGLHQVAGAGSWHPTWSPDGRVVFVRDTSARTSFSTTGRVESMKLDGSDVRPVGSATASGPVHWARG